MIFDRRWQPVKIVSEDGILEEDLPPIQRWLNRILALPIGMQNAIFEEFLGLFVPTTTVSSMISALVRV
jgi:hypothetical protein